MITTIEDTLEILAGLRPRILNIRLDYNEKSIIKSLGRQVQNGLALTDRQLDLAVKKIEKYRENLEKNGVDVNMILETTPLKMPVRYIDRSQKIFLSEDSDKKIIINLKFSSNKNFDKNWEEISKKIIGEVKEKSFLKEVPFNENNIFQVMSKFSNGEFVIENKILEIFEKIEKIQENPTNFVPYIDLIDDQIEIKNHSTTCKKFIDENYKKLVDHAPFEFIDKVKSCGIFYKTSKILEKIENSSLNDLSKNVITNVSKKFRVSPEKYSTENLLNTVDQLNQWPVLFVVDEDLNRNDLVLEFCESLYQRIPKNTINVFYRLTNNSSEAQKFNQYVKDNSLNNYIDETTKAVFISKQRIPKPLFRSTWRPYTAIVLTNHDFGKIASYLNNIPVVYYYNSSIALAINRIKGSSQIVEL